VNARLGRVQDAGIGVGRRRTVTQGAVVDARLGSMLALKTSGVRIWNYTSTASNTEEKELLIPL